MMDGMERPGEAMEPIKRLQRDLITGATTLGAAEARYLVDTYYSMQDDRIADNHQATTLGAAGEPHGLVAWLGEQHGTLEKQIARALHSYAMGSLTGQWSLSQVGIGPIIAAGLLAHIDIEQCPTVGHIWAFAGLNPNVTWGKGQKRPWNAKLKTLCWKIGESLVKTSGREDAYYGAIYAARKKLETERNEAGAFESQAKAALERKRFRDDTEAKKQYLEGRLPKAHIHARAKRYAAKRFLADWHAVAFYDRNGVAPPLPYAITHLDHVHYEEMPDPADCVPGLLVALRERLLAQRGIKPLPRGA